MDHHHRGTRGNGNRNPSEFGVGDLETDAEGEHGIGTVSNR